MTETPRTPLDVDFQRERLAIARAAYDAVAALAACSMPLGKRVIEQERVLLDLVHFHEAEYARLSESGSPPLDVERLVRIAADTAEVFPLDDFIRRVAFQYDSGELGEES